MPVDFDAVNAAVVGAFGQGAQTGAPAVYTPCGGSPFDLDGVFDEAWREFELGNAGRGAGFRFSTTKPVFSCRLADFPTGIAPQQGDLVVIGGDGFKVADIRPDGISGWIFLILN